MTSHDSSTADASSPLSYSDVRRLLALIFFAIVAVAFAGAVLPILLLFAVVFFMAIVLNSPIAWLVRRGVKRPLAVVLVIIALLGLLVLVGLLVVPPMLEQINDLIARRLHYQDQLQDQIQALAQRFPALHGMQATLEHWPQELSNRAAQIAGLVQALTAQLLRAVMFGLLGLLLLVFALMNPQPLVAGFLGAVPARHREPARRSLARLMVQMAAWMRATLLVGLLTGISVGALLYFIGVPYSFAFGVLAFFGEFVPNIGPVVATLPALLVAAAQSPTTLLWTLGAVIFVQQIESNLFVPFIMGRELELHPISIVFFALTMAILFGFTGAILAVPLAATTKILWDEFYTRPNNVPVQEIDRQATELVQGRADVENETADEEADEETSGEQPSGEDDQTQS
jgi:predicted PurR-regulated permease PerM